MRRPIFVNLLRFVFKKKNISYNNWLISLRIRNSILHVDYTWEESDPRQFTSFCSLNESLVTKLKVQKIVGKQ